MNVCDNLEYSIILCKKRTYKNYRRKILKKNRNRVLGEFCKRRLTAYKSKLTNVNRDTEILEFLRKRKFYEIKNSRYQQKLGNKVNIVFPERFSLFEDPNAALRALKALVGAAIDKEVKSIKFTHKYCENIDIGTVILTDIILEDIIRYSKTVKDMILSGETCEKTHFVNQLLSTSGTVKHFNKSLKGTIPPNIKVMDCYQYIQNKKNVDSGEAATQIVNFFNNCYSTLGFEITNEGKCYISTIAGEVLDNCKEHCGDDIKRWFSQGYYILNSQNIGECQLVFINFGNTIYESIYYESTMTNTKKIKQNYNVFCRKKRCHKIIPVGYISKRERKLFYTLQSLQDNISRKQEEGSGHGSGTVKLFTMLQKIGCPPSGEKAQMIIISGDAMIKFDGKYSMKKDNDGNDVIAFNTNNDITEAYDENYVFELKHFFPGSIILIKFHLDKTYLSAMANNMR